MTLKSAIGTANAVRAGRTTALAEAQAAIARIEARDDDLNAVVVRDFDRALDAARALDVRSDRADLPLAGVPMTIKESFDVAGLPTTWGLAEHKDFIADRDAEVVRRLKAAGAILLGKTNVPPVLADWHSSNPVYGVTRNPHDPSRVPGGSSGGSAVSLAAGYVPLEYGSDIGGSIRVPAHFCGVWGHKPSYGIVSTDGQMLPGTDGHMAEMSVVGPMARTPEDLSLALDLTLMHPLAGPHRQTFSGLRIAVLEAHPAAGLDDEIGAAMVAASRQAERDGAVIVHRPPQPLPDLAAMHAAYIRLLLTTIGRRQPLPEGVEPVDLESWWQMLDEQARYRRQWAAFFEGVGVLLAPIAGITAFPHDDGDSRSRMVSVNGRPEPWGPQLAWAGLANYPGLPATAMPLTRSREGLPIGMQVIGPRFGDRLTLAAARWIADALTK